MTNSNDEIAILEAKITIYEQTIESTLYSFSHGRSTGLEDIDLFSMHVVVPLRRRGQPPFDQVIQRLAEIVEQVRERPEVEASRKTEQ